MVKYASEGFRYGETNPTHVKATARLKNVLELGGWTIIDDEELREFHCMFRFKAVNPFAKQKTHLCDLIAKKVHNGPFAGNLETWMFLEIDGEIHDPYFDTEFKGDIKQWHDKEVHQKWSDEKFRKYLHFACYEVYELTDVRLVRIDKYQVLETEDPYELLKIITDKKRFAI